MILVYAAWPDALWENERHLGRFSLGFLWAQQNTNPKLFSEFGDKPYYVEYHWHGFQLLWGNAYILGGMVLLLVLLAIAFRLRHAPPAPEAADGQALPDLRPRVLPWRALTRLWPRSCGSTRNCWPSPAATRSGRGTTRRPPRQSPAIPKTSALCPRPPSPRSPGSASRSRPRSPNTGATARSRPSISSGPVSRRASATSPGCPASARSAPWRSAPNSASPPSRTSKPRSAREGCATCRDSAPRARSASCAA